MSKPYIHSQSSARRYGGVPEDYMKIHEYMDSSKSAVADVRHRAMFHSAFGIYIVQDVFGQTMTNSDGKVVSVRDIAEDHVKEDLGFIPTLEHWLKNMPIADWMMGKRKREPGKVTIPLIDPVTSEPTDEDVAIDNAYPQYLKQITLD